MDFSKAVQNSNNVTSTNNGGVTLKSSLKPLVDLFFMIGSVRGKDFSEFKNEFDAAFNENPLLTLQMLLWVRDVREGAGERDTARRIMQHLEENSPDVLKNVIPHIPTFGRWDDILIFKTSELKQLAYKTISSALLSGDALAAKWMPREMKLKRKNGVIDHQSISNKNRTENNNIAAELAAYMGLSARQYRKLLSGLSVTVEQKMCSSQWSDIDYSKMPSQASKRYSQAFVRNDEERYTNFVEAAVAGSVKVNAGAMHPHEISTVLAKSDNKQAISLAIAQWDALPDYMGDNKILPIIDTSGSMGAYNINNTSLTVQDVAVGLGLYVSTKQTGVFKDLWMNFSDTPVIKQLAKGSIHDKVIDLYCNHGSDWDGSTNVHAAFQRILSVATQNNLKQEDLPKTLLIFSDMEFDYSGQDEWDDTAFNSAKRSFNAAGYELPIVVFWNLNARSKNVPVTYGENGTALVSGFSPSIMKSLLGGVLNPEQVMLDTINAERYRVLGE